MQKKERLYYGILLVFYLTLSYSVFFIFEEEIVRLLTREDGVFETIGALSFFIASIIFFYLYFKSDTGNKVFRFETRRNVFFLMLALLFFTAAGEEISWGQRIFGIQTPEAIKVINEQQEFNIHNLTFAKYNLKNGDDIDIIQKLFLLFWTTFCLIIPISNRYNRKSSELLRVINFPIPLIGIGLLFLLNVLLARGIIYLNQFNVYRSLIEIKETNFALLFLILAIYFLRDNKDKIT